MLMLQEPDAASDPLARLSVAYFWSKAVSTAHVVDGQDGRATAGTRVIDQQLPSLMVIRSSGPTYANSGRLPVGDAAVTAAIVRVDVLSVYRDPRGPTAGAGCFRRRY